MGREATLTARPYKIGSAAIVMLVVLRICIGWHFLYEGVWKYTHPDFSSASFLKQAKGPLAEQYYALVPDVNGQAKLDRELVLADLDARQAEIVAFYSFDDGQQKAAARIANLRKAQVADWFNANKEPLQKHADSWERLNQTKATAAAQDIPYQQKRAWDKQTELRAEADGWGKQIGAIFHGLDDDLVDLASVEQLKRGAPQSIANPMAGMDKFMTYSILAIGFCLVVGLFTRAAAIGGAVFLLTIVLAQPAWPTIYPPAPAPVGHAMIINKEFIEMVALVLLACTAVGQWGGLDFFIHQLFVRPFFGKRGA
ncbi:MAG: hypothetical protein KF708_09635 [Pirellulales bacterium]|nr:hypothetical protein [Pirellulales bacterium]